MSRVLMFTSLKGGVGKTTAASALGFALSFLGARVLCVDLDFGVRGLDLALGAETLCGADVLDVIRDGLDPRQEAACLSENLFFLPAPALFNTREESALTKETLDRFLLCAREEFDFVLLDLPAGGGELFLPLAKNEHVTDALVVSTAEEAALRAAEQTAFEIRCACSTTDVHLILNRCPMRKNLSRSLFEMAQDASCAVLGVVPEDALVRESAACGIAPTRLPQSPSSQAYWNIASRLLGGRVPLLSGIASRRLRSSLLG